MKKMLSFWGLITSNIFIFITWCFLPDFAMGRLLFNIVLNYYMCSASIKLSLKEQKAIPIN